MKFASLALLLLPLAFCGTIPEENKTFLPNFLSSIDGYRQEISNRANSALQVANDALAEYGRKEHIENWPNSMNELAEMFLEKADINKARLSNVSLPEFVISLINGVSPTVSAPSSSPSVITSNGTVYQYGGSTTVKGPAPTIGLNDIFPRVPGLFNNSLTGGISGTDSEKLHQLCVSGKVGGLVACIGEGIAHIIDGFSNELISFTPLSDIFRYIGNALGVFLNGTFDIDKIVNTIVSGLSGIVSGDNPIGLAVRGIAQTIYNNPAAPIYGFVNIGQFIAEASKDVIQFFESAIGGLSDGTKNIISQIVNGVINKVLEVAHTSTNPRYNDIRILALSELRNEFYQFTLMRAASFSTDMQKFMKVVLEVMNRAYAIDPYFFHILTNPSEENIRKTVVLVAKVLKDYKN